MALEYQAVRLPKGFDRTNPAHVAKLTSRVIEASGPGWEPDKIDEDAGEIVFRRQAAVGSVAEVNGGLLRIDGLAGLRESDGPAKAKIWEEQYAADHPGIKLVKFEPALGQAWLGVLNDAELRCRESVATVLGVKPWDVTCQQRKDGGFTLQLPGKYVPSKHDKGLAEVAEHQVGKPGWYVTVDPKTLIAQIIPSAPPTFPPTIPFPFDKVKPVTDFTPKGDKERFTFMLAEGLATAGRRNRPVDMPLDDDIGVLLVGQPGSGKSVAIESVVYQALIKGYQLAVIDTPAKRGDFGWAKPYVHDHWWGADDTGTSVAEALTVATLIDEEGVARGDLTNEYGVTKWQELPPQVKQAHPPIIVVADELAHLLNKPNVPSGLPKEAKELPEFVKMAQNYLEAKLLVHRLNNIVAAHRAFAIRVLYISQRPSKTEGFPPELKSLLPHRVLLGTTSSLSDNRMAFRDERRIPPVPDNVRTDAIASTGVGIAHLDGFDPTVIKGFYASPDQFEQHLRANLGPGDPSDARVRPTADQISRCVPRIDGDNIPDDDSTPGPETFGAERLPSGKPVSSLPPELGPQTAYSQDGKRLKGAAAAAKLLSQRPLCPACDQPIDANGQCGCSF